MDVETGRFHVETTGWVTSMLGKDLVTWWSEILREMRDCKQERQDPCLIGGVMRLSPQIMFCAFSNTPVA